MNEQAMLTKVDGLTLAEAFPDNHRVEANLAGDAVARVLHPRQWTERFMVKADDQNVSIPTRLHFASDQFMMTENDNAWRFASALQTRSNDGFQRQRAARDVMAGLQPWAAPFVVALIGKYIVEILNDIHASLTPEKVQTIVAFIVENKAYWATTKRRVTSYWDVYYRSSSGGQTRRSYRRDEYVGFKLIDQLETAAIG